LGFEFASDKSSRKRKENCMFHTMRNIKISKRSVRGSNSAIFHASTIFIAESYDGPRERTKKKLRDYRSCIQIFFLFPRTLILNPSSNLSLGVDGIDADELQIISMDSIFHLHSLSSGQTINNKRIGWESSSGNFNM
jgi:hypothetical protein